MRHKEKLVTCGIPELVSGKSFLFLAGATRPMIFWLMDSISAVISKRQNCLTSNLWSSIWIIARNAMEDGRRA